MAAAPTEPAAQAAILKELARRIRTLGQDLSALSDDLAALVAIAEDRPADDARRRLPPFPTIRTTLRRNAPDG